MSDIDMSKFKITQHRNCDAEISNLTAELAEAKEIIRLSTVNYGDLQFPTRERMRQEISTLNTALAEAKYKLSNYTDVYDPVKSGLRSDEVHCACAFELQRANKKLQISLDEAKKETERLKSKYESGTHEVEKYYRVDGLEGLDA